MQQPISLPSTDAKRNYNLDLMGNWVDQGGTPAVQYTPACGRQKQESRTTNWLNQIATRNNAGLVYDKNGNLTYDGTLEYTFDALDRLATVAAGSGPLANYYYDAHHRRVRKVVNDLGGGLGGIDGDAPAGTTDYCYDGPEVLEERDPTNGDAVLRQFVWGEGEDDLTQQREYAGGQQNNYYPMTDHLGRTVALMDGQGNVICAFDTDAYGRTLVYINPGPDGQWFTDDDVLLSKQTAEAGNVPPLCPYVFTGQRLDLESKLYYYKARHYNPSLGRFVQRDPIGYAAGMNLYEYCGGMPTAATDPSGKHPETKAYWLGQLLKSTHIDPAKWHTQLGFKHNRRTVREVYAFYEQAYVAQPGHVLWAGLARLVGAPVFAGLGDLHTVLKSLRAEILSYANEVRNTSSWNPEHYYAALQEGLYEREASFVASVDHLFLEMNKAIFEDLGWQIYAYEHGGIAEMRSLARAHQISPKMLGAWEDIASNSQRRIMAGTSAFAHYEQHTVLGPYYKQLAAKGASLELLLSQLARNPVPGAASFSAAEGMTAKITDFGPRWNWVTTVMFPAFMHATPKTRMGWVKESLRKRAGTYDVLLTVQRYLAAIF